MSLRVKAWLNFLRFLSPDLIVFTRRVLDCMKGNVIVFPQASLSI
jgi:hypothetical protein